MSFLKVFNFFDIFAIKKESYVQDTTEDDCWEMIFKLVQENDPNDFVSLSLVCKRFLSITNQMKTCLVVLEPTVLHLSRALRRFQNLRSICIGTRRQHFDDLELSNLMSFLRDGLRELGMVRNGLKKLKCVGVSLYDADLILLTDLFPCLEELYLNCYKTFNVMSYRGVEVLASKLKKLRRVTFSSCTAVTDETIKCLSSNCKDLASFELQYCENVTENAIGFLMRHSSNLTSLILTLSCEKRSSSNESQFTIENSISYATNLEEIQFWTMDISDDFLCSIAKSCASLKRLDMDTRWWRCNFTMRGLETLLKACLSVKSFTPRALWLTDDHMLQICEYLRGLTYIDLSNGMDSFSSLTCVTFFMLTRNCPLIETIVMDNTKVGTMEDVEPVLVQNRRVKYLSMNHCERLNDRALLRFVGLCPNLESLDISSCQENFTDEGMAKILKACPKLRLLNISYVKVSNFLGSDNSGLKLKTIQAESTWIDDEALVFIGERCSDLEELKMGWCDHVTGYGVIVLVSMCKKLKRINMQRCKFSSPELILDWMLAKRPSLKEIVAPSGFVPSKEQRNLFLSKVLLGERNRFIVHIVFYM